MLLRADLPDHAGTRDLHQNAIGCDLVFCVGVRLSDIADRAVVGNIGATIGPNRIFVGRLKPAIPLTKAVALNLELVGVEARRPTTDPVALDYLLRGRVAMWKPPTPEAFAEAVGFFERALALDPDSVEAQSLLAGALSARAPDKMTDSVATDFQRAEALVGEALAASPCNPLAHYAKAELMRALRRCDEAIPEYETVLASNRNSVNAIAGLGWSKF